MAHALALTSVLMKTLERWRFSPVIQVVFTLTRCHWRRKIVMHSKSIEEALEEGLRATFPASDPVSVVQPQGERDKGRRKSRESRRIVRDDRGQDPADKGTAQNAGQRAQEDAARQTPMNPSDPADGE
jgi:hypothetical protein